MYTIESRLEKATLFIAWKFDVSLNWRSYVSVRAKSAWQPEKSEQPFQQIKEFSFAVLMLPPVTVVSMGSCEEDVMAACGIYLLAEEEEE